MRLGVTVRFIGRKRIVSVGDREDPRTLAEVRARRTRAADVSVIMVRRLHDELHDLLVHAAGLQHVDADIVMQVHQLGFVWAQTAGLKEDIVGNADLPHVVQKGGDLQEHDLLRSQPRCLAMPVAKRATRRECRMVAASRKFNADIRLRSTPLEMMPESDSAEEEIVCPICSAAC